MDTSTEECAASPPRGGGVTNGPVRGGVVALELGRARRRGADRHGPAARRGRRCPGVVGAVAALGRGASEDRLLGAAAAWTVARRAGARRGRRRAAVDAGGARSAAVVLGARPARGCDAAARGAPSLVGEWLALAAARGLRPPPELVPAAARPRRGAARRCTPPCATPPGRSGAGSPTANRAGRSSRRRRRGRGWSERATSGVALLRRRAPRTPTRRASCSRPRRRRDAGRTAQAFVEAARARPLRRRRAAAGGRARRPPQARPRRRRGAARRLPQSALRAPAWPPRGAGAAAGGATADRDPPVRRRRKRDGSPVGAAHASRCARWRRSRTWDLELVSLPVRDDLAASCTRAWAERGAAPARRRVGGGRSGLLDRCSRTPRPRRAPRPTEDPLRAPRSRSGPWGRDALEGGGRRDHSVTARAGHRRRRTRSSATASTRRSTSSRCATSAGATSRRLCDIAADPGCHAARAVVTAETPLLRQHAEQQFAEELAALERADDRPRPPQLAALAVGRPHLPARRRAADGFDDHAEVRRQAPADRDRRRHARHRPRAAAARRARHGQDVGVRAPRARRSPATRRCSSRARRAPPRRRSATAGTTPGCWPRARRATRSSPAR